MNTQNAFPLSWPKSWPRATFPVSSSFGARSVESAVREVTRQLKLLGVVSNHIVISTNLPLRKDGLPFSNQRQPNDSGVAVYFSLNKRDCVLAVDKWIKVEHNLWAIAKDIEAQRGRIRWGVGSVDQAFAGYTAIGNGGITTRPWREVFGTQAQDIARAEINILYKVLSRLRHPDHGGSDAAMAELNVARNEALKEITQ